MCSDNQHEESIGDLQLREYIECGSQWHYNWENPTMYRNMPCGGSGKKADNSRALPMERIRLRSHMTSGEKTINR